MLTIVKRWQAFLVVAFALAVLSPGTALSQGAATFPNKPIYFFPLNWNV